MALCVHLGCFLGKSGPKMGFQNGCQKCEKLWFKNFLKKILIVKNRGNRSDRPSGALKMASKTFYFEDGPKMASKLPKIAQKRSQNDPKMAQDCLKLPKIAPKTAQDSPKWVHKGSQNDPKLVRECLKLPKIYNIYIYIYSYNTYYMLNGLMSLIK